MGRGGSGSGTVLVEGRPGLRGFWGEKDGVDGVGSLVGRGEADGVDEVVGEGSGLEDGAVEPDGVGELPVSQHSIIKCKERKNN